MGEGAGNDEQLMPFIHAANIACGYHAGDKDTMKRTVDLALQYNVAIGAHPSFHDRENFGRTPMQLPLTQVYDLVTGQLFSLKEIVIAAGGTLSHVKPHGALYNLSAKEPAMADIIAKAVKDADAALLLYGLSGSCSITAANAAGLQPVSEVFADRTYQDDGSLTPRTLPGALIETKEMAVSHVLKMIQEGIVTTVSGKTIPILAETICIHGDGEHAVVFARSIYTALQNERRQ